MKSLYIFIFLLISFIGRSQTIDFSQVPGVVISHIPAADSLYIGSPSICILPNGHYIATHEYFGPANAGKTSVVQVFLSTDKGVNWKQISKIEGQVWSQLFIHKDVLHIIGPVENGGDVVIRRSLDGGYTWSIPVDGFSGRLLRGRYHSAPTPVVFHNNRIWKGMEDLNGPTGKWGRNFRALVMSAPIDADLLKASSWTVTNPMPYDKAYLNGDFGGWLEGNVVITPKGEILNILRTDYRVNGDEKASIINISEDGKTASIDPSTAFIDFPGGCKKFTIRHDPVSGLYWTLSNHVPEEDKGHNPERTRNTQALMYSADLYHWSIKKIVLHHPDITKHGFQYIDFQFEGNDLIAVSRTAYEDGLGGADNQHNANFLTFHRIKNFRD